MGRLRRRSLIRRPRADELDAVAALVAAEQSRSTTRNAFFGDTPAEVRALLESWERPWSETSVVAERDGVLVGFLGAELDESLGRIWLHGPVSEAASWDVLADDLLAGLERTVPAARDKDQELAGDASNQLLAAFAVRHGFSAGAVHHVLSLPLSSVEGLPEAMLPPLADDQEAAFLALHAELFPGTYYSGEQLLGLVARDEAVVLGLAAGEELAGYAAGRIDETGDGYIDFVGIAVARRRDGHGTALVSGICRALAARGSIEKVTLTVSSENAAALALYAKLGFERASSAVGYRRRPEPTT